MAQKKRLPEEIAHSEEYIKDFFDMVVPSTIKFNVDYYICGDSYRCVWAIREYPPQTSDQAILSRFGDKEAVTLHMYMRPVDVTEQKRILQNASRKNKMLAGSNSIEEAVVGEGNLDDVAELLSDLRKNREILLHCAVYMELSAGTLEKLRELQADVSMEMTREKLSVDRLTLRQKKVSFVVCPVDITLLVRSLNAYCRCRQSRTVIRSTIRGKPIPTDSILVVINSAQISLSILTVVLTIRQTQIF